VSTAENHVGDIGPTKTSSADMEARADCRTADCSPPSGGIAGRGASHDADRPTAIERTKRSIGGAGASPGNRRFLHRGNDRHILQRHRTSERGRLRIGRRIRIGQQRRRHYAVHTSLPERTAVQRTLQLNWKSRGDSAAPERAIEALAQTAACSAGWDFIRGANASKRERRSGAKAPNRSRFSLPYPSLHPRIAVVAPPPE